MQAIRDIQEVHAVFSPRSCLIKPKVCFFYPLELMRITNLLTRLLTQAMDPDKLEGMTRRIFPGLN